MKAKILIVDDEADLRNLLASVLEDLYEVIQANNGAALQKAFSQPPPDVVLLDVKLPDADGLELLPQIKKRWPDTEVIVLTGRHHQHGRRSRTRRRLQFSLQAV